MSKKFWKGKTEFYAINKAQPIRSKGCTSIAFKNTGTGDMVINGVFIIEEGGTWGNTMPHPDMFDDTEYLISFRETGGAGVAMMVYATALDENGRNSKSAKDFCEQF